jgi:transcriptional regulator with XRE-family HTH domain
MVIGDRLRALREAKKLSQGDIERSSGLLRCYVSRVENGHTVPAIDTLEKWARALAIPMYQLFYDGETPPKIPDEVRLPGRSSGRRGPKGLGGRYLSKMQGYLAKLDRNDRALILHLTKKIVNTRKTEGRRVPPSDAGRPHSLDV